MSWKIPGGGGRCPIKPYRLGLALMAIATLPAAAQSLAPWPIYPSWVRGFPPDASHCVRAHCDPGDPPDGVRISLQQMLHSPRRVAGDMECDSRCAFELVMNRGSCVSPDALVGFHAVDYPGRGFDARESGAYVGSIPFPKIYRLLQRTGWAYRQQVTYLSGRDLIGLGVPQCR